MRSRSPIEDPSAAGAESTLFVPAVREVPAQSPSAPGEHSVTQVLEPEDHGEVGSSVPLSTDPSPSPAVLVSHSPLSVAELGHIPEEKGFSSCQSQSLRSRR
ncbi:hypothetical protein LIER_17354 [Lithospermum erythrorhizon]|uniref:Uncharacterized protein n=1 Tax=Lithospermum erythrorhizon TaxID=34254 RepID=A0AAV3QA12_LITER